MGKLLRPRPYQFRPYFSALLKTGSATFFMAVLAAAHLLMVFPHSLVIAASILSTFFSLRGLRSICARSFLHRSDGLNFGRALALSAVMLVTIALSL